MRYAITELSPRATALTVAMVAFFYSLIFVVPVTLFGLLRPLGSAPTELLVLAILAPLFYFAVGYLVAILVIVAYNRIAKATGGIRVTIEPEDPNQPRGVRTATVGPRTVAAWLRRAGRPELVEDTDPPA